MENSTCMTCPPTRLFFSWMVSRTRHKINTSHSVLVALLSNPFRELPMLPLTYRNASCESAHNAIITTWVASRHCLLRMLRHRKHVEDGRQLHIGYELHLKHNLYLSSAGYGSLLRRYPKTKLKRPLSYRGRPLLRHVRPPA